VTASPAAWSDLGTLCGECTPDDWAGSPSPNGGDSASAATDDIEGSHLSIGSAGHPHACAEACRYVKRKGGCRDGKNCKCCHLCFWTRTADKDVGKSEAPHEEAVVSIGTRGHPLNCGEACKYARRKGGCRDGASCTNCHACLWQRTRGPAGTQNPEEEGDDEERLHAAPTTPTPLEPSAVPPVAAQPKGTPGIFGDSAEKLQDLIVAMLRTEL